MRPVVVDEEPRVAARRSGAGAGVRVLVISAGCRIRVVVVGDEEKREYAGSSRGHASTDNRAARA
jgi:hypothetical protein